MLHSSCENKFAYFFSFLSKLCIGDVCGWKDLKFLSQTPKLAVTSQTSLLCGCDFFSSRGILEFGFLNLNHCIGIFKAPQPSLSHFKTYFNSKFSALPNMLSAWHTFCIYLFYGIPSFILYILTFYIILRYRKTFDSSFFHLYLYDGALNLFTFLNNYFKTRIPAIIGYNSFIGAFYRILGIFGL